MSLWNIFPTKRKDEVLKTSQLVSNTHAEVAETRDALDERFKHLTALVDQTLREMGEVNRNLHSNNKENGRS